MTNDDDDHDDDDDSAASRLLLLLDHVGTDLRILLGYDVEECVDDVALYGELVVALRAAARETLGEELLRLLQIDVVARQTGDDRHVLVALALILGDYDLARLTLLLRLGLRLAAALLVTR